jgi:hypothetical protein
MSEPEHAIAVRGHTGKKTGATRRAGRRRVKRLPEKNPLLGKALQIWGIYSIAVRLNITPCIMGMNVNDIHFLTHKSLPFLITFYFASLVSGKYLKI